MQKRSVPLSAKSLKRRRRVIASPRGDGNLTIWGAQYRFRRALIVSADHVGVGIDDTQSGSPSVPALVPLHHDRMGELANVLFRILPWLMTTISANVIHYCSLWAAKREAHRKFQEAIAAGRRGGRWYPGSDPDEHEPLTFDLMDSFAMRRARAAAILVTFWS